MTPATQYPQNDESLYAPLAHIEAQEESFVTPLREYLEANGCRVIVNQHVHEGIDYHIVAGDMEFVKLIFVSEPVKPLKTLALLMNSSSDDGISLTSANRKIVLVDPVVLSTQDVMEIFSLFFSGTVGISDKRRNRHDPSVQGAAYQIAKNPTSVAHKSVIKSHPTTEADEFRIGSIIKDIFDQEGKKIKKNSFDRKRKKYVRKFLAYLMLTIAVVGAPIVWHWTSLSVASASLYIAGSRLRDGNATSAQRFIRISDYWISQGVLSFKVLRIPFAFAGQNNFVRGQERLLSLLKDTASSFQGALDIVHMGEDVTQIIFKTNTNASRESPAVVLGRLRLVVDATNGSLGLAQAELTTILDDGVFPFNFSITENAGRRAIVQLSTMRSILLYMDRALLMYSRFAGFKESKKYLVLLQNSNELRPSGGFISSVGKMTFDEGVLSDFVIQDVYALDGQLKGHVDPPVPIRELLGPEHWYLRDSNWDPDFKESAARAAWFYEKEMGEVVDGVIAVSLPMVVDILRVTGPILLQDYNDQITADNFFGKSIYYTKENFFPGSTQKSDFLGTLARTLLLRITTDKQLNPMHMFRAVADGLMRRDLMFSFADSDLQQLVEYYGWAGRIFAHHGCGGVTPKICLFDPLAISEANLSVSKVNAFVRHANQREIRVAEDGTISESIMMNIENTAQDDEPGVGGTYRTYIRFFLPEDASVDAVMLDEEAIPSKDAYSVATLPYIERVQAPEFIRGIGVAFEVDPKTVRQIRISYTRNTKLIFGQEGAVLDIAQYKQPGLSDVTQRTTIHYPESWTVEDESSLLSQNVLPLQSVVGMEQSVLANTGTLEYNTILLQDLGIRLHFQHTL